MPEISSLSFHSASASCRFCFEPSVAIDGAGRIVLADAVNIFVSEDGGESFETVEVPPDPPGRGPNPLSGADNLVQAGPDGRLYFSRLFLDAFTPGFPAVLFCNGVQVAASDDGGATWPVNTYVSVQTHLEALNADRQWLGFGPDGEVYLSLNVLNPIVLASTVTGPWGVYTARSDDGGATFGPFALVEQHADRGGDIAGVQGGPVTDPAGTVFQPLGDRSERGGAHGLVIARSTDRGASFQRLPVAPDEGASAPADWLPRAAVFGSRLSVAWHQNDGRIYASSSTDRGETWTRPLLLSKSGLIGPWIEAGPDGFDVTWHEGEGDDDFGVRFARIPEATFEAGGNVSVLDLGHVTDAGDPPGTTDFSHLAHAADGRAIVVWADRPRGRLMLAIEDAVGP